VLDALTCLSRLVMGRIGERDDLPREAAAVASAQSLAPVTPAPASDRPQGPDYRGPAGEPEMLAALAAPPIAGEALVTVAVDETGLRVEGGAVRIPLEVATSRGMQRLVVTVMVAPG